MVAGLFAGALLPQAGGLRDEVGTAHLLHLLWIYPLLFLAGTVVDAVGKHVRGSRPAGVIGSGVELVVLWAILSLMLGVYFARAEGAVLAAGIAMLVYWPFVKGMERKTARRDAEQDSPPDGVATG
ncbi:putative integral membrane protein [Clavibacter sepedonicus]|uniref:Integral membrane protein n=2 Tax=Microbacteriaceae TaxID=85023 RepID=B0REF1_CLASE|nr:putative integral membrane protein [Clavibacter sepedonicus]